MQGLSSRLDSLLGLSSLGLNNCADLIYNENPSREVSDAIVFTITEQYTSMAVRIFKEREGVIPDGGFPPWSSPYPGRTPWST